MSRRRDGGMATAELAVVLPTLVLIIAAGLTMVSVVLAQVRCVDAAREAARAAARGELPEVVRSAAVRAAPAGASVEVGSAGEEVRVTVIRPGRADRWAAADLPGVRQRSSAPRAGVDRCAVTAAA